MKIAVTALLALSAVAAAAPAESAQRPEVATIASQDDRAEQGRARREAIERRREAIRRRQEDLRRERQQIRRGPMASEPFSSTSKIGRQGTLTLVNPAGSVTIAGSGGDEVRIEATKRVWDRTEAAAKAALADVEIGVDERQGGVDVRTRLQRRRPLDAEVDFRISVPSGASVSVRSGSASVSVTGVRGELRVETVGGSVTAASVGQVRQLRTVSGSIAIENADSSDVTVSTLGGGVTIRQLKTRSADLRTVGGDLIIADSDIERLMGQSLSGRVEFTGRLARSGRYSLQSQSGDLRVTPTNTDDFELEAATVSGTVRSAFPITLDERRELTGPAGRRTLNRGARGGVRILRGLSGSGGPLVTLRSFSGDIAIERR